MLVGGGGAPGPQNNLNVEIYNPPYLYDASGARAAQARITSVPAEIDIGETFYLDIEGAQDVSRVTMIKTGSVTHSWNMEQRFVELTFVRDGSRLKVQAPTRAPDAPPGFWMIFALDDKGVPSHARIVKVNVASNWNPAITPTLSAIGNQSSTIGIATQLQLVGAEPGDHQQLPDQRRDSLQAAVEIVVRADFRGSVGRGCQQVGLSAQRGHRGQ